MARIEGLVESKAGLLTRIAYWIGRRRIGQVPEPLMIYAHNPWVLRAYGSFEMAAERARFVDKRLKALASIKAGSLVGCSW
jgi:hypothetical protein